MGRPTVDIEMPDGFVVEDVPDGTSKAEVLRMYNRKKAFRNKPKFERDAETIKNVSPVDLAMGSAPGRFVAGAADIPIGAMQLGAHILPEDPLRKFIGANPSMPPDPVAGFADNVVKQREESIRRGDLAYGREGFDWMRLLGNIFSPAALKGGQMLEKTPSALGRIFKGGLLGSEFGAATPVENTEDYWATKAVQSATGGALGLLIPGSIEAGKLLTKWGKHAIEPAFDIGRSAIKGREFLHAAGDKADDIVRLLDDNKQFVPGSKPTAAEAAAPAGRAEFAALQKSVSAHRPSDFLARAKEQDAARLASIRTISGTDDDLASAVSARDLTAAANYNKAFQAQIKADPELARLAGNRFFKTALDDALDVMKADGFNPKTEQARLYHLVKLGLDKQLGKSGDTALGSAERRAVQGVKSRLVNWLERKVPDYKTARVQFKEDSVPIDRMRAGKELENILTQPISDIAEVGSQRAGPFAGAIRDPSRLIKKAGQDPRFGQLKDILSKTEMDRVNNVASDLARRAQFEEQARAGMSASRGNVVTAQLERETGASSAPNALNRGIMILNATLKRLQGKAGAEVQEEMALEMLDPKIVAQTLKKAMVPQKKIKLFLQALTRSEASLTAGAVLQGGERADRAFSDIRNLVTP